jgi:enoyl reductase-like protein
VKHIYISPHLDDAALSCGGLIANQIARGESVQAINIFAGIPNLEHFSAYAEKQHNMWNLPPAEAILKFLPV